MIGLINLYLMVGGISFIACALYELYQNRGNLELFSIKKSLVSLFVFMTFWPWVVPYYIMDELK